jgi:hypothetical protein
MAVEGAISSHEAADLLDVSVRRVEQLVATQLLTRVAPGLVDLDSVHHYLGARQGRSRSRTWEEKTAWGAIALLSGVEVDWLGAAQESRIRKTLRTTEPEDLVRRTRNRAKVHRYSGHKAVAGRLAHEMVVPAHHELGLVVVEGEDDSTADGYVGSDDVERLVATYALRSDDAGTFVLRATTFDLGTVARITNAGDTLMALDVASSLASRERVAALQILDRRLTEYRGS